MSDKQIKVGISESIEMALALKAQAFRPLPDDHPCYSLVGRITAETARIDHLLNQAICNVAGIDLKVGACLTGQMVGPVPRFLALRQLAIHRGMTQEIIDKIEAMKGRVSTESGSRHRAVHEPWLEDTETGETHQFRGRSKRDTDFGPTPISKTELEKQLAEIRVVREEINELVGEIWAELRPAS